MATLVIPTRTDLKVYTLRVQLQGKTYKFGFTWNVREGYWYLDLFDSDDVPILLGKKIVANWPLLKGVADSRRPPGNLFALDATDDGDPALTDLGDRVALLYDEG